VQLGAGHKQLYQGVEYQNEETQLQPSTQRTLFETDKAAKSLSSVGDKFEWADGAPASSEEHGYPDHQRPPQTPYEKVYNIRLGVLLALNPFRGKTLPAKYGQPNEKNENGRLDHIRKQR
jgi:hypothetical protein